MISIGAKVSSARTISLISGAMLPASLRTGTTTERRGTAALDGNGLPSVIKSSVSAAATNPRPGARRDKVNGPEDQRTDGLSPSAPAFLWTNEHSGNSFDPSQRRACHGVDDPIGADEKPDPAHSKPITHHQGAECPECRAGDDIARIVGRNHHSARRDQQCIDPQYGTNARKDDADSDQRRECGRRMAGREACIFRLPRKRLIGERSNGGRPHAADPSLRHRTYEPRQADRDEYIAEPRGHHGRHRTRHEVECRRCEQSDHHHQGAYRHQNPSGATKISDFIRDFDQPLRQAGSKLMPARVEQQHREHHCADCDRAVDFQASPRRNKVRCKSPRPAQHSANAAPNVFKECGGARRYGTEVVRISSAGGRHGPRSERYVAMLTAWPPLMLKPSMRGPIV